MTLGEENGEKEEEKVVDRGLIKYSLLLVWTRYQMDIIYSKDFWGFILRETSQ